MSTKAQVDTKREQGSSTRRRWSKALKRQIVAETLEPGSSVSIVARRHDVNTNQVFTWRRELVPKKATAVADGTMVPVEVAPERAGGRGGKPRRGAGIIEIELGSGARVTIRGEIAAEMLRRVLDLLR